MQTLALEYKPLDGVRSVRRAVADSNESLAALFALLDPADEKQRKAQEKLYIPGDKVCLRMVELEDPVAGLTEQKFKTIASVRLVEGTGSAAPHSPAAGGGASSASAASIGGGGSSSSSSSSTF